MTRRKPLTFLATAAALPLVALAVAGCGGSAASASSAPPTTPAGHPATVGLANTGGLGQILVDSRGRTLYLFQADAGSRSACTGACAVAWPPLRASGTPVAGSGLAASKLGTAARADGKPQVTYNGHPLYRYSDDEQPGDATGQGVNAFGASWFVLSPAGARVAGSGSGSGSGSGYGGGGGY